MIDNTFKMLNFDADQNSILMIEPPQTDLFRKEFVEYLFEQHNSSGLYFKNSSLLASFLHSKENSIVIDIGGYNTYVSAVSEGNILQNGRLISAPSSKLRR